MGKIKKLSLYKGKFFDAEMSLNSEERRYGCCHFTLDIEDLFDANMQLFNSMRKKNKYLKIKGGLFFPSDFKKLPKKAVIFIHKGAVIMDGKK